MRSRFRGKRGSARAFRPAVRVVRASTTKSGRPRTTCRGSSHRSSGATRSFKRSPSSSRRRRSSASSEPAGPGKLVPPLRLECGCSSRFPHGVWFVELAPLQRSGLGAACSCHRVARSRVAPASSATKRCSRISRRNVCSSFSTTASTSFRRRGSWRDRCFANARASLCWRRVASS